TFELIRRLSDPLFFQALSCVVAYDWHSSGTTTTSCGALKEALTPDLGVVACGGKGKVSRKAPEEIAGHADGFNISEAKRKALLEATMLTAKVDSSCVQDNHNLYHHSFFMDERGNWAVIQQGMNAATKYARRYHWMETENFTDAPPESIAGVESEDVLNLVSAEAGGAREHSVGLVQDNPNRLRKYFTGQTCLFDHELQALPARHEILRCDLTKKDWRTLNDAYELQPKNYRELVSLNGMGKKKLRALALVSKLLYGSRLDWKDPVKYSFAHGGKDGIPYPVDRKNYDHTISFLQDAIEASGIDKKEKATALRKLAQIA
ncbi:TPA: DUF763 domain-containing protein, partial [Candidatus Micrarchaeota archaeon]|nr:DUF763 domain-containing protein [Candidatus Micrarchaeota archaeon]